MKEFFKEQLTKIFVRQAKKILKAHNPLIVVVVGSVGKTSTKYAIASVLKQKYRVCYQEGNYNVPLTLSFVLTSQQLPTLTNPFGWLRAWLKGQKYIYGNFPYEVVLLELGTDFPGDIAAFKDIFTADIAVVSAISEEHMEFFGDIETVAEEELSVAQFSQKIIINADDCNKEFIKLFIPDTVEKYTYGYYNSSDYKVSSRRNNHHSFNASIRLSGGEVLDTEVSVAAKHALKPLVAAVAVGHQLDLTSKQIQKGIVNVTPAPGRMRILEGTNDSILIDDTYNSSPLAAEAALEALYDMKSPQKIAILGSMNELGAVSQVAHEKIGTMCNPNKLNLVITIGEQANKYIAAKAEEQGCNVIRTSSPVKAGKVAAQNITEKGAIILAKGSQNGVFAEEAIKQLLANTSDIDHLVRQNDFWMNKKANQFGD